MIGGNLGAAVQMLKVMNQQGGANVTLYTADTTTITTDTTTVTVDSAAKIKDFPNYSQRLDYSQSAVSLNGR